MSSRDANDGFSDRREGDAPDPAAFGRGAWSVLMAGEPHTDSERYAGRALPALLRERWAIQATRAAGGGTYFILVRKEMPDLGVGQPAESPAATPPRRASSWSDWNMEPRFA